MTQQVNYALEMSNTWDDLYAHVTLEDVDIGPGDEVLLHNVPVELAYGATRSVQGTATYQKAHPILKWWTKQLSRFEITMLYEVSFSTTRFSKHHRHHQLLPLPHSRQSRNSQ